MLNISRANIIVMVIKMKDKIKTLRKSLGYSQEELAKIINVHQTAVSQWEQGRTTPDIETIKKLASLFNVSVDYLLGRSNAPANPIAPFSFANIQPIKKHRIPLLGEIACGEPLFADEDFEGFIESDIEADFALRCSGDSMTGARIMDGDIVLIKKQDMVENGEIAAVIIENEATLKRVYYYPKDGKLILNPENPAYAPLVYVDEELNQIRILGRAVAFYSKVR